MTLARDFRAALGSVQSEAVGLLDCGRAFLHDPLQENGQGGRPPARRQREWSLPSLALVLTGHVSAFATECCALIAALWLVIRTLGTLSEEQTQECKSSKTT